MRASALSTSRNGSIAATAGRISLFVAAMLLGLVAGVFLVHPAPGAIHRSAVARHLTMAISTARDHAGTISGALSAQLAAAAQQRSASADSDAGQLHPAGGNSSRQQGQVDSSAAAGSRLPRLPPPQALDARRVRRGTVTQGDETRARRVVAKLLRGEPITVAVVGGSISWGHGASKIGETDWPSRVFSWVRTAFPEAQHVFQNGAIPSTTSAYMALCVNWHVPATADIVIMEYATNDGFSDDLISRNFKRRSYERLARRLLRLPNGPAVLQLSSMPFSNTAECCSPYWQSAEDQQGVIAQYYGLPWLSLRAATWEARVRGEPGYVIGEFLWPDWIHPVDRGHQMLADLVTGFLASVAEELVRRPFSNEEEAAVQLPLLPPMIPGNEAYEGENCIMDEDFHKFVTHTEGFDWIVEGGKEGHRPKPGYIATAPGSSLRFTINSAATAAAPEGTAEGEAPKTVLVLSYLGSYEHMGQAEVKCVSGCECETTVLDGHWEKHESQLQGHRFSVSQHAACEVEVRVIDATASGEHKVKLTGVVMGDDGAGMQQDLNVLIQLDPEKGFSKAPNG